MTYINQTLLPAVEEVSMEAVASCIVEGVVELVSRLIDTSRHEESLEEDGGKSLGMSVRTGSSSPTRVGVDHVRVGGHVESVQSAVPAGGEGHLGPDVVGAELWSGREARSVLVEVVAHTLVVDVPRLGLGLQGTSCQHSGGQTLKTLLYSTLQ